MIFLLKSNETLGIFQANYQRNMNLHENIVKE